MRRSNPVRSRFFCTETSVLTNPAPSEGILAILSGTGLAQLQEVEKSFFEGSVRLATVFGPVRHFNLAHPKSLIL